MIDTSTDYNLVDRCQCPLEEISSYLQGFMDRFKLLKRRKIDLVRAYSNVTVQDFLLTIQNNKDTIVPTSQAILERRIQKNNEEVHGIESLE